MEPRTSILILLLAAASAHAAPSIRSLGVLNGPPPNGGWASAISSDGRTVCGYGNSLMPSSGVPITLGAAARLSPTLDGNFAALPPLSYNGQFNTSGFAFAASNVLSGGSLIVGTSTPATTASHATLWYPDNSRIDLGASQPSTYSAVNDITPDGSIGVGLIGIIPTRWTILPSIFVSNLNRGTFAGGAANAVSADGAIIAGSVYISSASIPLPVRWVNNDQPQLLGLLTGSVTGAAFTISDDGSTIAGSVQNASGSAIHRPFLWRAAQGMIELTSPAATTPSSRATSASADGHLIGGYDLGQPSGRRAIMWNRPNNPRLLADILAGLGVDLTGWSLSNLRGISADGTILSGLGNLNGVELSFLATLPPPCPADYNLDYTTDFFDYLDFVADFASNRIDADFNLDGAIDFFDYLDFIAALSSAC